MQKLGASWGERPQEQQKGQDWTLGESGQGQCISKAQVSRDILRTQSPCRWTKPGQGLAKCHRESDLGQLRGPHGGGKGSWGALSILVSLLPAKAQGCPRGSARQRAASRHSHSPSAGQAASLRMSLCGVGRLRLAATRAAPTGPCPAPGPPRLGSSRLPGRTHTPEKLITAWLQMKFNTSWGRGKERQRGSAGSAGKRATCLNETAAGGSGRVGQGWRQGRPRAEPGHVCGSAPPSQRRAGARREGAAVGLRPRSAGGGMPRPCVTRRGRPRPGAQVAPAAAPVCPYTAAQSPAEPSRTAPAGRNPRTRMGSAPPRSGRVAGPGGGTHQFSCIHWMAACSLNCFSNSYSCKVNTDMFIGPVAAEPLPAPRCCLPPPREPGPCAPAAGEPPPLAWPAPPQRYPGFSIAPLPSAPLLPGPPVSSSSAAAAQRPGAVRS